MSRRIATSPFPRSMRTSAPTWAARASASGPVSSASPKQRDRVAGPGLEISHDVGPGPWPEFELVGALAPGKRVVPGFARESVVAVEPGRQVVLDIALETSGERVAHPVDTAPDDEGVRGAADG